MLTNAPLSQIPEEISKDFRILRLLSRGGHGSVYLAEDRTLGNLVAIKMLRLDIDEQTGQIGTRLKQEARTLARLHHPHIVTIHRLVLPKGAYPALVMEYVEGPTLSDVMAHECPLDLRHLRMIFIPIAQALHYAHSRGVVHRDIKPSNILIRWEDATAKLVDFSIAWSEESAGLTKTSTIIGTPHYMSPEQSDSLKLDYHSDIYSFGVVLYECACGRLPFYDRSDWRVLRMHVETPPPRPTSTEGELPEALVELILQCLAKSPDKRPQSAEQIAKALDALLPPTPEEGHPPLPTTCFNPGQGQRALVRGTDSALIRKGLTPPSGTSPQTPHQSTPESDSETFAYTESPLKDKPASAESPSPPTPSTPSPARKTPSSPLPGNTGASSILESPVSRPFTPDSDQLETSARPGGHRTEINQLQTIVLDEEQRAMIEKGIDPDAAATSAPNSLGAPPCGTPPAWKTRKVILSAAVALVVLLGVLAGMLKGRETTAPVGPAPPAQTPPARYSFVAPVANEIRSLEQMNELKENQYLFDNEGFRNFILPDPKEKPVHDETAKQATFQLLVSPYSEHIVDVWLEEYEIKVNEAAETTETLAVYRHVAENATHEEQSIRVEIANTDLFFRRLGANRGDVVPLRFLLSSRTPFSGNLKQSVPEELPIIECPIAFARRGSDIAARDTTTALVPEPDKKPEMSRDFDPPAPTPAPAPSITPTPTILFPPEFRIYKAATEYHVWVATSPPGVQEPDFMKNWSEKQKDDRLIHTAASASEALYIAGENARGRQNWYVSKHLRAKGLKFPFEIQGFWEEEKTTGSWLYKSDQCSIIHDDQDGGEKPKTHPLSCGSFNNIDHVFALPAWRYPQSEKESMPTEPGTP
jgi:serine/threonine protein kinase